MQDKVSAFLHICLNSS